MAAARTARIRQDVHWSERHAFLQVRTTFSSRQPYAAHFHDCLSLGVVFKGSVLLCRGGGAPVVDTGEAVLISPLEPHSCNPVGGRARGYHMFYIETDWALRLLNAPPGAPGGRLIADKTVLRDKTLFAQLMRLVESIRKGREDRPGRDALAEVVAAHCAVRPAGEEIPSAIVAAWTERADCFAEEGRGLSVAEEARELGMRRESFIRSFRRATGVTPAQYRQCQRLNRARALLQQGRSLVDTALACGYADQSHFHRMCVKYLSATPVQMRPQKPL